MEGPLAGGRGKAAGSLKPATFEECEAACIANEECKSLLYSKGKEECSLKKLELTGTEAIAKKNPNFFSAYKTCEIGKKMLDLLQGLIYHFFTFLCFFYINLFSVP